MPATTSNKANILPKKIPNQSNRLYLIQRRRQKAQRQRRRFGFALILILAVTSIFAVISARGILAENQVKLDRMQSQIQALQHTHQDLDKTVASLESPSRIASIAKGQLGMAPPSTVINLPSPTYNQSSSGSESSSSQNSMPSKNS